MDADIVQAVLDGSIEKAVEIAIQKCGNSIYTGGARELKVCWVTKGTPFIVEEYDGSESLRVGEYIYQVA